MVVEPFHAGVLVKIVAALESEVIATLSKSKRFILIQDSSKKTSRPPPEGLIRLMSDSRKRFGRVEPAAIDRFGEGNLRPWGPWDKSLHVHRAKDLQLGGRPRKRPGQAEDHCGVP